MKHIAKECDCGEVCCSICGGGLFICEVCGLAEGSLTTDCPGEPANKYDEDVYNGKVDYREGQGWVWGAKNPTNQTWEKAERIREEREKGKVKKSACPCGIECLSEECFGCPIFKVKDKSGTGCPL
jgi:hypothetical protein